MRTKEQQQYLSNLASTMLQQLRVPEQYGESADVSAIFRDFGAKIRVKVVEMTPKTRGRIAELGLSDDDHGGISMFRASGIGNLNCRVHGGSWLIIELATMTIAAMMWEILCAEAYRKDCMDAELEKDGREFAREWPQDIVLGGNRQRGKRSGYLT